MKALILAGGKGTRLYPLTYTCAKQLVPVANKPVLHRVIEAIREAGITDLGIVVGDTASEIKQSVGDGSRWDVTVQYIGQDAPLGLAHAVKISQDFIGEDRFVMFLGDNVIQGGISTLIRKFESSDSNAQVVLTRVAHPQQYGVAVLKNGTIVRLVEKPRDPPSDLALVGIYMFDTTIFKAVNSIGPSWRNELEITDASNTSLITAWWSIRTFTPDGGLTLAHRAICWTPTGLSWTNSTLKSKAMSTATPRSLARSRCSGGPRLSAA